MSGGSTFQFLEECIAEHTTPTDSEGKTAVAPSSPSPSPPPGANTEGSGSDAAIKEPESTPSSTPSNSSLNISRTSTVSTPTRVPSGTSASTPDYKYSAPVRISPTQEAESTKWKKKREQFKTILGKFVKNRPTKEDLIQNKVLQSDYKAIPLKFSIIDELCTILEKTGIFIYYVTEYAPNTNTATTTEGIFRVSGRASDVRQIWTSFAGGTHLTIVIALFSYA